MSQDKPVLSATDILGSKGLALSPEYFNWIIEAMDQYAKQQTKELQLHLDYERACNWTTKTHDLQSQYDQLKLKLHLSEVSKGHAKEDYDQLKLAADKMQKTLELVQKTTKGFDSELYHSSTQSLTDYKNIFK